MYHSKVFALFSFFFSPSLRFRRYSVVTFIRVFYIKENKREHMWYTHRSVLYTTTNTTPTEHKFSKERRERARSLLLLLLLSFFFPTVPPTNALSRSFERANFYEEKNRQRENDERLSKTDETRERYIKHTLSSRSLFWDVCICAEKERDPRETRTRENKKRTTSWHNRGFFPNNNTNSLLYI